MLSNGEPLSDFEFFLFSFSGAGVGKSYSLNCIQRYIRDKHGAHLDILSTAAPTGTAAFSIDGKTLHALLQIPVTKQANKALDDLDGDPLMRLQSRLEHTKLIVIDEMSMISPGFLYKINKRLQEAFPDKKHLPFGGVSIVLMGDFAQLPPVMSPTMFAVSSIISLLL